MTIHVTINGDDRDLQTTANEPLLTALRRWHGPPPSTGRSITATPKELLR